MDMKEKHGIKDKMNRIDYRMEDRPSYLNENSRNNISTEKIVGNIIEQGITKGVVKVFGHKILWQFNQSVSNIYDLVFGQDGYLYASGDDGKIIKIDPTTGSKVWLSQIHHSSVNAIIMDPQGYLYTGSNDYTVKKIDPFTGKVIWIFKKHSEPVYALTIDVSGNIFLEQEIIL